MGCWGYATTPLGGMYREEVKGVGIEYTSPNEEFIKVIENMGCWCQSHHPHWLEREGRRGIFLREGMNP